MILEKHVVGAFKTNCYIIGDKETNEVVLIDAGDGYDSVLEVIKQKGYVIKHLLITHGHFDHILGIDKVKNFTQITPRMNIADKGIARALSDFSNVVEGDIFTVGRHSLRASEVPGHSEGSVCYSCKDIIFSGDTLFRDMIGRTDLHGGNLEKLTSSIKNKLLRFDDNVRVLPGHGPETTIGHERANNPFLL